ncbi:hypothetical protein DYB31_001458 [Aphanomyces astaci]|uniref:5'-3' exonuclease domain-containing protein n=1 Tax=Aphanomyces astaci TaxID=112090 RepID=A0A397F2D2_APHAT|nr:hypothetical protein DYB31_001458 [Aphanomyces astaci]
MKPHRVCVFFDTPVITQRKKEDPTYKVKRERMGDALRRQFPLTGSVLKSLAVPVVQVPGVEADDMIASYTKASLESGFNVIVVSNDSDFFQLVQSNASPTVSLYKFRTRWLMGQDEVLQLIGGTSPRLHPDLRALRGDQWGKTPGLPGGISKELAVELLETAGGLLPLLESLDNVQDEALRNRLHASTDMLKRSYRASKLDDSLALPIPLQDFAMGRVNQAGLALLLTDPTLVKTHALEV